MIHTRSPYRPRRDLGRQPLWHEPICDHGIIGRRKEVPPVAIVRIRHPHVDDPVDTAIEDWRGGLWEGGGVEMIMPFSGVVCGD
jgi:hypothetical protein